MESDEKKKSGKGIIIVVVILLLVIILGAVGGFFIISKMNNSDQPKKIVEEVIQLDDIVVNIKDPSNKKYVKVSLAMTYDSKNKKALESINLNIYKIKDAIITIFKDKSVNELESSEGIESVKLEIKNTINSILESEMVLSIYFTNLLVN